MARTAAMHVPAGEGGVHQGHQTGTVQKIGGRGLRLLSDRTMVPGLFRVGWDGPGVPEFLRTGNAAGDTKLLHHPV